VNKIRKKALLHSLKFNDLSPAAHILNELLCLIAGQKGRREQKIVVCLFQKEI